MKWTAEHAARAAEFLEALKKEGFDFFTGVPCSLLGALLEKIAADKSLHYVPAVREDAAVGMAAGAALAGRRSAVLMQNSGLGYSLNALTSLNLIYKIPALLVITYRGFGPDAPEHLVMGKACEGLLREVGIKFLVPEKDALMKALAKATVEIEEHKKPFAVFIKRGIFGE